MLIFKLHHLKNITLFVVQFGEHERKRAIIKHALCRGKSADMDYWLHLRNFIEFLGLKSCRVNLYIRMQEGTKFDGIIYWEYILLYTNDFLCVSENPERVLRNEIANYFIVKELCIGLPAKYLGVKVRKVHLDNGVECWAHNLCQYV